MIELREEKLINLELQIEALLNSHQQLADHNKHLIDDVARLTQLSQERTQLSDRLRAENNSMQKRLQQYEHEQTGQLDQLKMETESLRSQLTKVTQTRARLQAKLDLATHKVKRIITKLKEGAKEST